MDKVNFYCECENEDCDKKVELTLSETKAIFDSRDIFPVIVDGCLSSLSNYSLVEKREGYSLCRKEAKDDREESLATYCVETYEKEYHSYTYYIEATSPGEAEELVRAGGMDYARHKWVSGEIVEVSVSIAEEEEQ